MEHEIQNLIALMPHLPHELHHPGRCFHFRREPDLSQYLQSRQKTAELKPA
jgi:hypothetical protein